MEVKLEVERREVIKPSSPSPHDHHLQLSLLDLASPGLYVSTVFFYKAQDLITVSPETISRDLKSSLSETLSRFYPLAGRIKGASAISCNDEGAVFTESRTDTLLPDFLRNINTDSLKRFSLVTSPGDSAAEWPLLGAMVTFFGSRSGVAVTVSVSHKICDAISLLTFVTDWANTTARRKSNDTIQFAETTIYLPPPHHLSLQSPSTDYGIVINSVDLTRKCVVNRFVFESCKIAELKRKASSESVPVPTRVEAISALVLRCARNASRAANSVAPSSTTLMYHPMDLRLRIPSTVLSRDAIGNLNTQLFLKQDAENNDLDICETVAAFRKAKEVASEMIKESLQGNNNTLGQYLSGVFENFALEIKQDVELYTMSSWCKRPFYEVDFGWGDPVWIGSVFTSVKMVFVWLIDSKDGDGVEAWIGLPEQDMTLFLRDQDLLAYAVLNPPVLI